MTERHRDKEIEGQKYIDKERQKYRDTYIQRDRETENRETAIEIYIDRDTYIHIDIET